MASLKLSIDNKRNAYNTYLKYVKCLYGLLPAAECCSVVWGLDTARTRTLLNFIPLNRESRAAGARSRGGVWPSLGRLPSDPRIGSRGNRRRKWSICVNLYLLSSADHITCECMVWGLMKAANSIQTHQLSDGVCAVPSCPLDTAVASRDTARKHR